MTTDSKLTRDRINYLIDLANRTLATKTTDEGTVPRNRVNAELFFELRSSSLSLILKLVGEQHPFYKDFDQHVKIASPYDVERGKGILKSVKAELDSGFIN